jgi:hypothetical protein
MKPFRTWRFKATNRKILSKRDGLYFYLSVSLIFCRSLLISSIFSRTFSAFSNKRWQKNAVPTKPIFQKWKIISKKCAYPPFNASLSKDWAVN